MAGTPTTSQRHNRQTGGRAFIRPGLGCFFCIEGPFYLSQHNVPDGSDRQTLNASRTVCGLEFGGAGVLDPHGHVWTLFCKSALPDVTAEEKCPQLQLDVGLSPMPAIKQKKSVGVGVCGCLWAERPSSTASTISSSTVHKRNQSKQRPSSSWSKVAHSVGDGAGRNASVPRSAAGSPSVASSLALRLSSYGYDGRFIRFVHKLVHVLKNIEKVSLISLVSLATSCHLSR